jgi:hypothetical protein
MNGAEYVALVELTQKDGSVVAAPGETCERVNPKSLGWLLDGGYIEHRPVAAADKRQRKARE